MNVWMQPSQQIGEEMAKWQSPYLAIAFSSAQGHLAELTPGLTKI